MEAENVLETVFGVDSVIQMRKIYPNILDTILMSTKESIEAVKMYFRNTLLQSIPRENLTDNRIGRIGPKDVRLDFPSCVGLFYISPNRTSIIAQGNFCTIRANTGIYKEKWMYEVQLGSKGVMQIGWGTLNCKYTTEAGVGDTPNSYSYDGNRLRKWNVIPTKYGESWLPGDIIGCTLDMNNGTIGFYRNGRNLGKAFDNISMGPGIAYFPTISLTYTENLTAIFGDARFRYPIEDFQPIQAPPEIEIKQASFLLHWINLILDYMIHLEGIKVMADNSMTVQAFLNCILQDLLVQLSPLLGIQYVIEVIFVPFLYDITEIKTIGAKISLNDCQNRVKVMTFLDLLWAFLEEAEVKFLLENIVNYLYSLFRHISYELEYSKQYDIIALLINLCLHTSTRHYYLKYVFFDRVRFSNFIYIKPMDDVGLENIIREPWWETYPVDKLIDSRKSAYFNACEEIKAMLRDLELIQIWFLVILLNNEDGTATRPSSRSIFLKKFQHFVYENFAARTTPQMHIPMALSLCSFHRLLTVFKHLWDKEVGTNNVHIPCAFFYDGTINYPGIERLGGVLTHLRKLYKLELIHILGPNHKVINSIEQPQNQSRSIRREHFSTFTPMPGLRNYPNNLYGDRIPCTGNENRLPQAVEFNNTNSLLILLDSLILFYHATVKKQVTKLSTLQDNIFKLEAAFTESKKRLLFIEDYGNKCLVTIQQELMRTMDVYDKKLCELSRQIAWVRATVFSEEKVAQLSWFLQVITRTLWLAGEEGNMFSFVPDFYLDTLSDLCSALRTEIHPITPLQTIPDYSKIILEIGEFLCRHYMNPVIVNVNSKETLLLIFAGFVSHPLTLRLLETVTLDNRLKVVKNLLKPLENRSWAHPSWILMRFWQGHGFAFRYEQTPHLNRKPGFTLIHPQSVQLKPYPSSIFQLHIRDRLLGKPKNTEQFLNCILNQINWAFSEFIGMVQEIHNCSLRSERTFIESRQLKICSTCFELAVTLLRVLEMFCFLAPDIFIDIQWSSSEILLCRLFQLLCQILNRMSLKNNAFQEVLLLDIPDLGSIHYFPILTAVIGVLLLILRKDIAYFSPSPKMTVPRVTRALLMEPSFQLSSLYFVLGENHSQISEDKNSRIERFSFLDYLEYEAFNEDYINDEEINKVREMLNYLNYCHDILPDLKNVTDDENLCTICYAYPKNTRFIPCGHMTCHLCINRHLLNTKECFFCKTIINKIINISNDTLENLPLDLTKRNVS